MTELNDKSQYQVPVLREAVPVDVTENSTLTPVEQAYRDALDHATSIHAINPEDVDTRRIEFLGATSLTATEVTPKAPEVVFDPSDHTQFSRVGEAVMLIRRDELARAA